MADLISRQAAIDAIQKAYADTEGGEDKNAVWKNVGLTNALHIMQDLPLAQPETHEKRTETHACDCISRKEAIDAHYEYCNKHPDAGFPVWSLKILEDLPSAQPKLNKEKISDLLWNEYQEMSSHLSTEGVVARRYFCKELWKELFGEEETPVWMTW